MEIVKKLIPAMEWLVGVLKDTVKFIKEYSSALTLIIGIYATYKGIMLGIIALEKLSVYWKGISTTASELLLGWDMARATGLGVLTSAQWALNLAMDANPIGLIVLGIAALIALIYELVSWIISLSNHFGGFGKMLIGVWDIIKAFGKGVGLVFFGLTEIILGFLRAPFDGAKLLKQGLKDTVNAVKDAGKEIDAAWNKDAQEAAKEGIKKKSNIPAKVGATGKPGGDGTNAPTPKTKAEGQKTINIHVAYNAPLMSGGITISTTNLHEGAGKIKEILTEMLVGATHDTLMVADY